MSNKFKFNNNLNKNKMKIDIKVDTEGIIRINKKINKKLDKKVNINKTTPTLKQLKISINRNTLLNKIAMKVNIYIYI